MELAQRLYDAGEHTVAQIADMLKVPRTTVYGHLGTGKKPDRSTRHRPNRRRLTDKHSVVTSYLVATFQARGYRPGADGPSGAMRGGTGCVRLAGSCRSRWSVRAMRERKFRWSGGSGPVRLAATGSTSAGWRSARGA
ncbi:hypothetical protein [Rhodococcus oxybenzonivorans]|uniref:hypothetical protein n=1 Tax=Rhodococcus TaxID=1827 RepID=UPI0020182773|nr:hypothetical protein [Rhodococcus sp. USK13]